MTEQRLPFAVRLSFVVMVVAEIAVLVLLASTIGGWATFLLVVATAFLGGWVIRKEGLRAWTAVRDAVHAGDAQPPELGSSQAAMAGGFLLLLPGFITDVIGLLLVLSASRGWARRYFGGALRASRPRQRSAGPIIPGDVVDGEVVDPEQNVIQGDIIDPDNPRR